VTSHRFRIFQRGQVLRFPAQPRIVQHILGIGGRAEHPVGQAEQTRTVLLEQIGRCHGGIPAWDYNRTREHAAA
jgi:hypothetical protein